jgi:hypothetical protein
MPTMVNVSRLGSQKCFQKSQLLGECELHQTASKHLTESVIKKKNRFGNPMVGWVVIRGQDCPLSHRRQSRADTVIQTQPDTKYQNTGYITSKMTKWP